MFVWWCVVDQNLSFVGIRTLEIPSDYDQYVGKNMSNNVISIVNKHGESSVDWEGKRYVGLTRK
jgi:hypothetical protein